jgi:hypothetical protein
MANLFADSLPQHNLVHNRRPDRAERTREHNTFDTRKEKPRNLGPETYRAKNDSNSGWSRGISLRKERIALHVGYASAGKYGGHQQCDEPEDTQILWT